MSDSAIVLNEEQVKAIETLKNWVRQPSSPMAACTGSAGSGKTTILKELKQYLPGNTEWCAMTGRAALRLSEVVGVDGATLHKTLYKPPRQNGKYLNFNALKTPQCKVLIIDESSLASPKVFEDLKTWQAQGVKILFIGDGYQLPPVMTYKEEQEFGDDFIIFREVKGPHLTKVMRSTDGIVNVATYIRDNKSLPSVGNNICSIKTTEYPGLSAVEDYLLDPDDHILITWTNKSRMQGNAVIRKRLGHHQPLPEAGEPVLVCKNGQERLNGEVVYADRFDEGPVLGEIKTMWMTTTGGQELLVSTVGRDQFMDGNFPDIKDWKSYHFVRNKNNLPEPVPVTYGYCWSFHKIQGNEARRASVFLSRDDLRNRHFNKITQLPTGEDMPFSMRAIYTGLTRAKERATLYLG